MGGALVDGFKDSLGRWTPRARGDHARRARPSLALPLDLSSLIGVWSSHEDHLALRDRLARRWLSPAIARPCESAARKPEMNDSPHELWDLAKTIYSIGLLAIGVVLTPLAIAFLWLLPGALRVGRQLAKAITRHAKVLERDADAADTVRRLDERTAEMHDDMKVIKARLGDGES
jgi:hypothetical protein